MDETKEEKAVKAIVESEEERPGIIDFHSTVGAGCCDIMSTFYRLSSPPRGKIFPFTSGNTKKE
jgi:hypothetical protein